MSHQVRVLVSGMDNKDNPITRALMKYEGCQVYHFAGDPGNRLPKFCDIAIIATEVSSHQAMWDVKKLFKEMNRPFLVTTKGFSEIKEEFENFLKSKGKLKMTFNSPQITTPAGHQLKHSTEVLSTVKKDFEQYSKKKTAPERALELSNQGVPQSKIAKTLNGEGYRRPRNNDLYKQSDIGSMLRWAKGEKTTPKIKDTESKTAKKSTNNIQTLINFVLDSKDLNDTEKINTIKRINSGEITQAVHTSAIVVDQVMYIEKSDISRTSNKVELSLTREQARLVVDSIKNIQLFAINTLT